MTAHGDCSHEIKRRLLLGRKVMTNLDSILKSRDIILPTKEQVSFNFIAVVTIHSDYEAQENQSVTVSILSPSICHEVMGPDAMIFVF